MTDIQYAFTHFLRMFVVITVIAVGYGYLLLSILTTKRLAFILQLLSLVGLSALFSFLVLRSSGSVPGDTLRNVHGDGCFLHVQSAVTCL